MMTEISPINGNTDVETYFCDISGSVVSKNKKITGRSQKAIGRFHIREEVIRFARDDLFFTDIFLFSLSISVLLSLPGNDIRCDTHPNNGSNNRK